MHVLVTGATGYVGGRLVPRLIQAGHTVRTTVTDPSADDDHPWWADQVETVPMDILDAEQVLRALEGMDAAFYLVHGMGGDDFVETDRQAARNVAHAVEQQGVPRVVYLSGIVPKVPVEELSDHITSRMEVEQILSAGPAVTVTLRAAVILGSGSTSFEIIRQVSERMPVQTVPTWMNSDVQPIAVVDVIEALVAALDRPDHTAHLDVGGPDVLPYANLLDRYADIAGLTRPQVEIPFLPTQLVGALVGSLTDVPSSTVEALVESLHHDMVCDPNQIHHLVGDDHDLVPLDEAIRRSLAAPADDPSTTDPMAALPHDPHWASGGEDRPLVARVVDGVKNLLP